MQSTFGKVLMVVVALIAGYVILGWVFHLAMSLLAMVMPVLIIGGVVYVLYLVYGKKALGGGRRTLP
jgi:hypothetical protein